METPRVRLDEIARRAGVSKMTVSLALRGETRISEATREKVRRIAQELGYTPDPALAALSAYRRKTAPPRYAGTIAYLNAMEMPLSETPWRYSTQYFLGAKERGQQLGFSVEEFWLRAPGMNLRSLNRILMSRGIVGLVVGPMAELHVSLNIDWATYSSVALGYSMENPKLHTVANNHFQSICLCVQELVKLGYRRPGFYLQRAQDERVMARWSGGFLATTANLLPSEDRIAPSFFSSFDPGAFQKWMAQAKPDAVISGSVSVRDQMHALGYRIPGDVGFVMPYESGYKDQAQLAHIDENCRLCGATAIDLVSGMFYRNERGVPEKPLHVMVQGEWRPGTTVIRRSA